MPHCLKKNLLHKFACKMNQSKDLAYQLTNGNKIKLQFMHQTTAVEVVQYIVQGTRNDT